MSNLVQFPETYLIKDIQFWKRYLSLSRTPQNPICTLFYLSRNAGAVGEMSYFSKQNSNKYSKEICSHLQTTRKVHISQQKNWHLHSSLIPIGIPFGKRVFFFFRFLENRMSIFQKHTYLPYLIMSEFA
jgi:hypothetical protein